MSEHKDPTEGAAAHGSNDLPNNLPNNLPDNLPDDLPDDLEYDIPPGSMYPDMDDLELVTMYLNGHLDAERTAAVHTRLRNDPEFLEFAQPMLLTWSAYRSAPVRQISEEELVRDWNRFAERAGIKLRLRTEVPPSEPPAPPPAAAPRKRIRWGRWIAVVIFGFLAYNVGAYALKASANAAQYIPENDEIAFTRVPYDTGWIDLNDGITVRLEPGASLRTAHRLRDGKRVVKLLGTARFRITARDTTQPPVRRDVLLVEALVGSVGAFESEFTVTARPDTTLVQVHRAGPRTARERDYWPVQASLDEPARGQHHFLLEGEGARIMKGHDIEVIRPQR